MMKHWKAAGVVLGAALLVAGSVSSVLASACGDVNDNTTVGAGDPGDCILLLNTQGGAPNPAHCGGQGTLQCGDLRQDGSILSSDTTACLQNAAQLETLFPLCTGEGSVRACPRNISGTITTNQVWDAACDTFIDGTVIVQSGVVVTIRPGAVIKGIKDVNDPAALIFARGSKINAAGTAAQPIVMTSNQAPGARSVGDWGGLSLLGAAPVNFPGGQGQAEGLPPGTALFGGNEPNDSSGVVTFTRIEFSGVEFSADNELNVFTMNGVGAGTTINHVQANVGFDDCNEWFGGTVKAKYMISSACRDDLFDWQIGFTGALQHGLAYQNASIASGDGREGFEADNSEFGADDLPRSNPRFCNMTVIGCKQQGCNSTGNAARLRRGTAGKIHNSILMDFPNGGVRLDGTCDKALATPNGTCSTLKTTEPILRVADTLLYNVGADNVGGDGIGDVQAVGSCSTSCGPTDVYDAWVGGAGVLPTRNTNGTNPLPGVDGTYPTNATLAAESAAFFPANGGIADDAPDCSLIDPFFDTATYIGAFDPNGSAATENDANNWLRPTSSSWVSFGVN